MSKPFLTAFAKRLRGESTDAEKLLWKFLRSKQCNGSKFRRQQPIGKYIVDFVCFEKKVVIELDGGQHSEQAVEDRERDAWLQGQGFTVLRFWNNEMLPNIEGVYETILRHI